MAISNYSLNARHAQALNFFDCIIGQLNGHIQQSGVIKIRSRTYSLPQFQNVTTALECILVRF